MVRRSFRRHGSPGGAAPSSGSRVGSAAQFSNREPCYLLPWRRLQSCGRGVQLLSIEASGGDEHWASEDDDPETSLIRDRERVLVRALIKALPLELRELLVLRELEELSYKEVADVTHSPIGTVMSRLWRARRQFAREAVRQRGAEC